MKLQGCEYLSSVTDWVVYMVNNLPFCQNG